MMVLILGGGVAGLGIGWRLLQAGAEVTILDRGQPAAGATWAAAGMLAVTAELEDAVEAERALALRAAAAWPDFAAELEAASGRAVHLSRAGSLLLAADAAGLEALSRRAGDGAALVGPDQAKAIAPLLADTVGGLWSPDEMHVDSRALGEALAVAVLKAGGTILPNEPGVTVERHGGRALSVLTPFGRYHADAILVAAGAWSGLLGPIAIQPVKGQMIALAPPPGVAVGGPVVWGEGVYCVPRPHWPKGGRLLVGATVEEAGFDTSLTVEARDRLRAAALRLMPGLKDWALADQWAGLRPRSPDGLPLLGGLEEGLFVAGGQYRNGILFAPAISQDMADLILGKGAVIPAFDPLRFSQELP